MRRRAVEDCDCVRHVLLKPGSQGWSGLLTTSAHLFEATCCLWLNTGIEDEYNWADPGRSRKSTRSGASGVIELTPLEFLDRLAALIPPPRRHRHRYHGVFAPNHPLRQAVTALVIGNIGKQRNAKTGDYDRVLDAAGSGC